MHQESTSPARVAGYSSGGNSHIYQDGNTSRPNGRMVSESWSVLSASVRI